ncbi:hypothetical protein OG585_10730 [Streptomyces sp. NBC_01340]|uniref:hypothetical protein n=1 Tax=unclassified Streptomyces TaxID=2593676 RepID=UPI0022568ADA|nr:MULTISPECIES: hypothetical protein [unclassified Streptomyces]MCX4453194.1 hypothetical protein [Streptomyces sp. NBC_01719]MCX4492554.1 hypothetical protein [Streptomyces sp. NBC_01728]WSI37713.1 hypothetical protein OG585_10730 [Streptomyces sp. NBC_01340]
MTFEVQAQGAVRREGCPGLAVGQTSADEQSVPERRVLTGQVGQWGFSSFSSVWALFSVWLSRNTLGFGSQGTRRHHQH